MFDIFESQNVALHVHGKIVRIRFEIITAHDNNQEWLLTPFDLVFLLVNMTI